MKLILLMCKNKTSEVKQVMKWKQFIVRNEMHSILSSI